MAWLQALSERLPIVLTAGFRFFFLSAGLLAVASLGAWLLWLGIHAAGGTIAQETIAAAPQYWHGHEMIFGYAVAVVAGFFLTAVPSWTNTAPARAFFISGIGALWLLGRIAVWFAAFLPAWTVALVDIAFLPILTIRLGHNLRNNPQPRNIVVVGLLALVTIGNLLVHLDWMGVTDNTAGAGLRFGLFVIAVLIAVIGGRVVPAFTRNALLRQGEESGLPVSRPLADKVGIGAALAFAFLAAINPAEGPLAWLAAAVALTAGIANSIRLSGWRGKWTLRQPILWSLHLGFAMLCGGYFLMAGAYAFGVPHEIAALHLTAIGGVGGMTLAMMTRASLGHTGRSLEVARPIAWAYGLIAAAAVIRALGLEIVPQSYYSVTFLSGGLWITGFALFSAVYWPILTRPRASA